MHYMWILCSKQPKIALANMAVHWTARIVPFTKDLYSSTTYNFADIIGCPGCHWPPEVRKKWINLNTTISKKLKMDTSEKNLNHSGNLLAKDGEVTAILDWSCCRISDPVMDVASTLVVFNAATKHIIPSFDSKIEAQKYLEAYRSERDLNEQYLRFFKNTCGNPRIRIRDCHIRKWY